VTPNAGGRKSETALRLGRQWAPDRPHILVIACSDGRLQTATDEFLSRHLTIVDYDRLYLPGGAGALCPSGRDFMRAHQMQQECRLLIEVHQVENVIALFHGPGPDGPVEAICADYRRKMEWGTPDQVRERQTSDAHELLAERWQWAGKANVSMYRCEVEAAGNLRFVTLHADPS
jgi:hypothetical protein